ncbi:peptidase M56 BlaR1 [Thalassoporum mexicanum PCC 7367]|uniref:M56 family metallopeptidase n=1 Tax=Thalassoporum mexicanum TaxID=3457544 RepID=UPI00029FF58F|nr:M56 family metallopeptidase [Pseudanabaena sp. PCC 7367]AFY70961.1 peptidase M56 BlaR1 [Pseudanabaena sp. PCC 7367]
MHLVMILSAIAFAWGLRQATPLWLGSNRQISNQNVTHDWHQRWWRSLFLLTFPPLLVLTTSLAVLCMGHHGLMVGLPASKSGCAIAVGICIYLVLIGLQLFISIRNSTRQIATYNKIELDGKSARVLEVPTLFAAQVGLWQPELVISRGMLTEFTPDRLQAVLCHEQAHYHYHDTFWFFWLGWLRQATFWLPNTEALWQELLLLRELRADRWAAQQVDPLLLAESLLMTVTSAIAPDNFSELDYGVGLNQWKEGEQGDRLAERIDALLAEAEPIPRPKPWYLTWLIAVLLPFLSLPLHLS